MSDVPSEPEQIRVELDGCEVEQLWKLIIASGQLLTLTYLTDAEVRAVLGEDAEIAIEALGRIRDAFVRRDAADPATLPAISRFERRGTGP
jgi:hypothetical protein